MNRRQKIKKLKKENDFMRMIIKDNPEMEQTYNLWKQPLRAIQSHVKIRPYKCKRIMTYDLMRCCDGERVLREEITRCLLEAIKPEITYRLDEQGYPGPILEGTILIGHQDAESEDKKCTE